MKYSFSRYLAAKRGIDDRSFSEHVWRVLVQSFPDRPLAILEAGSGTGTMIERLAARGIPGQGGLYTAVDASRDYIEECRQRVGGMALDFELELEAADIHEFAARETGHRVWDLLVAHAFLDLVHVPSLLPQLFALMRPGGLFYFTVNFDGLTAFLPPVARDLDERIVAHYHRTMDERSVRGRPTGGSRAGRQLLTQIPAAGGEILAAGASDWVVLPQSRGYAGDEAYFLQHILLFFESSLSGRPDMDAGVLSSWLAERRRQIDAGQLIFIAHQLDICGRVGQV